MNRALFEKKLLGWYHENKRSLPWRDTIDPYKIWLSEIILQQTRVAQGLPYYERFIKVFPTVFELAKAPTEKVLRLWQGLGYYSRARNLHQCAKAIVKDQNGKFPSTFEELKELPGIGPYTAAAIASIAFKEPVAVVDGNVFRVLSRIFGIDKDISSPDGKAFFFEKANQLISPSEPHTFNQAMMEFGALYCTPQNPACDECVFARSCVANQQELQAALPVKSKKQKVRNRYFYYLVVRDKNKLWMKERRGKDIWQGLYDFYLVETKRSQKSAAIVKDESTFSLATLIGESKMYKHILSHQKLMVRFIETQLPAKFPEKKLKMLGLKSYTLKEIARLPKPILIANYLKERENFI